VLKIAGEPLNGRTGHAAGRQLLARLYREETGQECPEIAVAERGKPYFLNGNLHFSISHTKDHVFCALSDRPVGLDAEETDREIKPQLAEKILSEPEKRRFDAASDRRAALLRLWVLKEAAAKLSGEGLRGYPNHTDFAPDDPRITEIDGCYVAVIEG
jgi:4'-phosphopantetheinyl transferase